MFSSQTAACGVWVQAFHSTTHAGSVLATRHTLGTSFTLGLVGWSPDQLLGMDSPWQPLLEQPDITVEACAAANDLPFPLITGQQCFPLYLGVCLLGISRSSGTKGCYLPGQNLPVPCLCMF